MALMKSLTIGNFTGEIPSKTSELANDSGFVDAAGAAAAAPVQSVNEKTGDVVLDAADVGALTEADLIALLPVDTASGSIASFPDGADNVPVEALTVGIQPVQDLHGQSNPWPAGGGKNKFDLKAALDYWGATYTDNGDGSYTVTEIGSGYSNPYQFFNSDTIASVSAASVTNIGSASGWTLQFMNSSNVINANIKSDGLTAAGVSICKVRLNYGSKGSGATFKNAMAELGSSVTTFAPYSNICPISGHNQATVTRKGANVWDETWENGDISSADGTNIPDSSLIRTVGYIPVKPDTAYYCFCGSLTNVNLRSRFYDADKNYIGYTQKSGSMVALNQAFTTPVNAAYLRFSILSAYGNIYKNDISINYPSTDTTYHAHEPTQTVTVDLNGTRYGGTLDVLSGQLAVDRALIILNGSQPDSDFQFAANPDGAVNNRIAWRGYNTIGKPGDAVFVSDTLKTLAVVTTKPDNWAVSNAGGSNARCFIGVPATITSVADWQAYVTNNPITLVYYLATPTVVSLDPETLTTLLGTNNVYSDAGDTSVTYRANIQKYIQKLLGA